VYDAVGNRARGVDATGVAVDSLGASRPGPVVTVDNP
jgi:hypothetical protein